MSKVRKAIIPAAGLGTRFLPATKAQPKEMLPIVDKPTIQYIVEEAVQSGIEDIVIVNGRNKQSIEDHFDRSIELEVFLAQKAKNDLLELVKSIAGMANIYFIRQKEALGLGHAIYSARSFIGEEPFAVLLGDDVIYSQVPVLRQMMDQYDNRGVSILGVQEVALQDTSKYGIVDGEKFGERLYRAKDMVEKPQPENAPQTRLAIMGRYILTPEIFPILRNLPAGSGGEIQLTDGIKALGNQQEIVAYEFEGRRYDVGDKLGFIEATVEYALRREELREDLLTYLNKLLK